MRRRLVVHALWALVAPALIGAYAFSGARLAWTASSDPKTPRQPWAFALAGPTPAGITSGVALVSYTVSHDHASSARQAIADGNRLIARLPTGYRLAAGVGARRIAVREQGGVFYVCALARALQGPVPSTTTPVECAAGPLPLRFADVAWTSGRTLAAAANPARYREARAMGTAAGGPSTRTVAALAIDWLGRLGHGRSGAAFALLLAAGLLGIVAFALRAPRRRAARAAWSGALGCAVALVAVDVGARVVCGPACPRFGIGDGIVNLSLGGAQLHRNMSIWGDEGPLVELVVLLAVSCAVVVALRRGNRLLMFAAAVTLLGTATNLGEVTLRAYDTDYLWVGNGLRMTPFNLGDVYELGGGVLMAYCCLRTIVAAPPVPLRLRLPHADAERAASS